MAAEGMTSWEKREATPARGKMALGSDPGERKQLSRSSRGSPADLHVPCSSRALHGLGSVCRRQTWRGPRGAVRGSRPLPAQPPQASVQTGADCRPTAGAGGAASGGSRGAERAARGGRERARRAVTARPGGTQSVRNVNLCGRVLERTRRESRGPEGRPRPRRLEVCVSAELV